MEEFVSFNFVLLDASALPSGKVRVIERGPRRERIDLIARQFHDFLKQGDPADTSPHGLLLTHDFKLRRQVGKTAGWLAFMVDRGEGVTEELEEAALMIFARANDPEGRLALRRLDPYMNVADLSEFPLVAAVKLVPKVPLIINEWYGKAAASFFSDEK